MLRNARASKVLARGLAALFLALPAAAPIAAEAQDPPRELLGVCRTGLPMRREIELEVRERECLGKVGGIASRRGRVLTLATDRGNPVRLASTATCDGFENCTNYRLVDHLPGRKAYVVRIGYWESEGWLVVDQRNGQRTFLPGEPHFSPGGTAVASIAASESSVSWNGVEVWSAAPSGLKRAMKHEPSDYALYGFAGWDGEDRVRMKVSLSALQPSGRNEIVEIDAEATRDDRGWTVRHHDQPRLNCDTDRSPHLVRSDLNEEEVRLHAAGDAVTRSGDTLRVRVASGETLSFRNGACGPDCRYVFLHRIEDRGLDIIRIAGGDTERHIVVDERTGTQAYLSGAPHPTLDGRQLAVVGGSTAEVWSVGDDGIWLETRHESPARLCFAGWDGDARVMLRARLPGTVELFDAELVRGEKDWTWRQADGASQPSAPVAAAVDRTARSVCIRPEGGRRTAQARLENACLERLPALASIQGESLRLVLKSGAALDLPRTCSRPELTLCRARLVDFDPAGDAFLIHGWDRKERRLYRVDRGTGALSPAQP